MKFYSQRRFDRFLIGSRVAIFFLGLLLLGAFNSGNLFAGGGPENVFLVVNGDSPSSKMIANYYIQGRNIPAGNVMYLNGIPDSEIIDQVPFLETILKPVLKEIELRKLVPSVDYIVYSSDFPTGIGVTKHLAKLKELVKQQTGRELPSQQIYSGRASITSATYFAGAFLANDPGYITLNSNRYYRQPASVLLRQPFQGSQQETFRSATGKIEGGHESALNDAIDSLEALAKKHPRQLAVSYWLARAYAKLGDEKKAAFWLVHSIRSGWCYQKQTLADMAFEKVKDDPIFKGIVKRIPDQEFDFLPTHGFKNQYAWGPNGMLNSEPGQGSRHYLSTILAVTRNHGMSEKQALRYLELSMIADESKPEGTFYFTDTSDVRTKTRKPNIAAAVEGLKQLGMKTEVVTTTMPVNRRDVLGLTSGTSTFNWTASGSKIIPGAFCDNLTSHGGSFSVGSQTKLTEFLANGAAGSSGTVIEPFALQAKFPHPMIHLHYVRGCSLAEAFYQSVHGPFQTVVVGDALCQPWATKPVLKVEGLSAGETVKGQLNLNLDVSQSPVPIVGIEFYVDGVLVNRAPVRKVIAFDTVNMADGYHEIRLVSLARGLVGTSGHVVLPIEVNNKEQSVKLTTEYPDYLDTDEITFKAKSNFGDSIELVQNGRSLAKKIGSDVEFKVPAKWLGRGPVKIRAIAISESGGEIASMPIELQIGGRVAERPKRKQPKPKPKPKPKPQAKPQPSATK